MWRALMALAQAASVILFVYVYEDVKGGHPLGTLVPLLLILLVIINTFWFTRAVSWIVFAGAFFSFLVILSAFTLRWRLEEGFNSFPFYRAIGLYVSLVYVSLAQLKILGGKAATASQPEKPQ